MGIIIYGSQQTPIDYDEFFVKCPCCETHQWADAMLISNYYHMYWLPIFPFDKEVNLICRKCGLKRYGIPFEPRLISNFNEIKSKFHHPWFTYSGVALIGLIFLGIVLSTII